MKRVFPSMPVLAVAGACLVSAGPAAAQFTKPEDAIKYRRAAFTMSAAHFGRVSAMANGRVPFDAKALLDNAEIATMATKLAYAGFINGTDKGDTRARPEVWSEMDKFRAAASKMQDEMGQLNAVAKTGNLSAIKAKVGDVASACKACHNNYRQD